MRALSFPNPTQMPKRICHLYLQIRFWKLTLLGTARHSTSLDPLFPTKYMLTINHFLTKKEKVSVTAYRMLRS